MVFTDLCHGEVNVTSLWHPSDMVPHKPATDIIVNAVARVSGSEPKPSWSCGLRIEGSEGVRLEKRLTVTGPREWRPRWHRTLRESEKAEWQKHRRAFAGWELSEPEPCAALPLHYEYAYGGEIPQGEDEDGQPLFDTDHRNPLGRGKIDRDWSDHTEAQPAPRIEDPDQPVSDPYAEMLPQAFGPIPPAWLPRRPLGGTYDQNWQDNIWPAWPPDYDFAYHNSAHPDLIVKPHLVGDERIVLTGLSAFADEVVLTLPGEGVSVAFVTEEDELERRPMVLDTVFLDIAAEHPADWRVYLGWRVTFEPDLYREARIYRTVPGQDTEDEEQA